MISHLSTSSHFIDPFELLSLALDRHLSACEEDAATSKLMRNGGSWAIKSVECALRIVRRLRWAADEHIPAPPDVGFYPRNPRKALSRLQHWCDQRARERRDACIGPSPVGGFDCFSAVDELKSILACRSAVKQPTPRRRYDWDVTSKIFEGWDRSRYRTIESYADHLDEPVDDVRRAIDRGRKGPPKFWKPVKGH